MKLDVQVEPAPEPKISVAEMKPGQFGRLTDCPFNGMIVLRTYDRIVGLEEPGVFSWSPSSCVFNVVLLPPSTSVTLTVRQ